MLTTNNRALSEMRSQSVGYLVKRFTADPVERHSKLPEDCHNDWLYNCHSMDIRHFRYFVSVAEAGSFVAASRILKISQPALSSRVKELETWAGKQLFQRIPRGVALTQAGANLLPHVREVLVAMMNAENAIRGENYVTLAMGVAPTPAVTMLPQLLASAIIATPPLRIQVQQGASDELVELVAGSRLQVALCYRSTNIDPLISIPLYSEELCLVGARALLGAVGEDIPFDQLPQIPLIVDPRTHATRRQIDEIAFHKKLKLDIRMEVEPANAKRVLIEGQQYCAVVPKGLFMDAIRSRQFSWRPIADPKVTLTLSLVANSSIRQKVLKQLIEIVKAEVAHQIAVGGMGWRLPDQPSS